MSTTISQDIREAIAKIETATEDRDTGRYGDRWVDVIRAINELTEKAAFLGGEKMMGRAK